MLGCRSTSCRAMESASEVFFSSTYLISPCFPVVLNFTVVQSGGLKHCPYHILILCILFEDVENIPVDFPIQRSKVKVTGSFKIIIWTCKKLAEIYPMLQYQSFNSFNPPTLGQWIWRWKSCCCAIRPRIYWNVFCVPDTIPVQGMMRVLKPSWWLNSPTNCVVGCEEWYPPR